MEPLQKNQSWLSSFLAHLPGMAYRCRNDVQFTTVFVSDGCQHVTGYPAEAFLREPSLYLDGLMHPEDRKAACPVVERAVAEREPFQVVYRIKTARGEEKWILDRGVGFSATDGQVETVEGFAVDITDRVRMEQELEKCQQQLEEQVQQRTAELAAAQKDLRLEVEERRRAEQDADIFKRFAEAAGEGFAIASLEGTVLYVNSFALRLGGYQPEQVIGKPYLSLYPEAHRRHFQEEILPKVLRGGQVREEIAVLTATGTTVQVMQNSFVVPDNVGNPAYLVAVMTDIADRKEAERARERERQTLRHTLCSSDHERQTIAYEIHDGLAQQLAAAIMQFQTHEHLRKQHPDKAGTAYEAGVEMVRQAHFEARRLISGVRPPILDEAGIVVAIAHLVHEQRLPKGPTIEFHSDVAFDRLTPVFENALYRVAQEALANACRHSRSQRVRVSLVQQDNAISLEVQDWGTGFDPSATAEERFGLEGIRQRARLLGGQLHLTSRLGQGTLLRVELPLLGSGPDAP